MLSVIDTRSTWSPPWYAWAGAAAALLLAVHKVFPEKLEGHWLLLTPIAIVIGIVALRRLWDAPPVYAACAAITLTIFSNGWSKIGLGGLPLNRIFVLVIVLQFVLRAPGIAGLPRLQLRNVHLLMGLTALYALASAAVAGTLTAEEGLVHLTDVFGLVPFLLFFLAPSIFAGARERNALLATLVGLGFYLGVTGIFEAVGPHALVFPSYITKTDLSSAGAVRVSGPFQSPVAEGFGTFACAVAALLAFQSWRAPRARLLAALAGVACLFACFATLERGVWIAAALGTIAAALMTRQGRRWLVPGIAASLAVIAVALAVSSALASNTSQRAGYDLSVWDRQNQTSAGLRMVEAKPLLGFGWDRYEATSGDYFRQATTYPLRGNNTGITIGLPQETLPLHDTYLSYAVELGLVGLLLWLTSLATAVVGAVAAPGTAALRSWKLGLIALGVFFLVIGFFDPHEQPFPVALLMLWAGLAHGAAAPSAVRDRLANGRLTPAAGVSV
jgi:O-antigen ligase